MCDRTKEVFLLVPLTVSTIDLRPALTFEYTSADRGQQLLTSFYAVCGALFAYKREITYGVFGGEGSNARDNYLFLVC